MTPYHERLSQQQRDLLESTGNIWAVDCWDSGNRRRVVRVVYCRTDTPEKAEAIARRVSKRKTVDARPWNPTGRFFQRTAKKGIQ